MIYLEEVALVNGLEGRFHGEKTKFIKLLPIVSCSNVKTNIINILPIWKMLVLRKMPDERRGIPYREVIGTLGALILCFSGCWR